MTGPAARRFSLADERREVTVAGHGLLRAFQKNYSGVGLLQALASWIGDRFDSDPAAGNC